MRPSAILSELLIFGFGVKNRQGHTHEEVREVVNGIKLSRGTSYGENGVPFGEGMVEVASFNSVRNQVSRLPWLPVLRPGS